MIDKETKRPLQGVNVCLVGGSCEETNAAGEYSFSKLLAGTYALDFYAGRLNKETGANYLSQYESYEYIVQAELKARNPEAGHVDVTMGGRAVIDDELEEGGRISGTMLEAGTEEPASLWPCAEDLSTGHPEQAEVCPVSMSGNTYTISGLPPGRYRVVFGASVPAYYFTQYYDGRDLRSQAQEVLVESGHTTGQIDAALIANPDPWEGAIAGTVTDSSSKAAIAGIEVCPVHVGTTSAAGSCATTNAHGEYLLTGLANGEYAVEFRSPPDGSLDYLRQRYGSGKAVTVVWGSITPAIDSQLHEGGAISGVAQNAVTGQPAGGVSVCAYDALGESEACARTDASGSYRLPGLVAGGYTVGFETTRAGGAYFPQYFDEATSASQARSVPVEVGRTTAAVGASLFTKPPPGDGEIAGLVTDASRGAPLSGIDVCAYKVASGGLLGECAVSTAGGRYLLAGLAPGEYELEFSSPPNGNVSYVSMRYEEGRSVRVAADGIAAGRDARLMAVRAPSTEPLPPQPSHVLPVQPPQALYSPMPAESMASASSGVLGSSSAKVPPSISLTSSTITLSGRAVWVDVACGSAPCSGSVVLTARIAVPGRSRGKHHRRAQTIVLGRGSFALASGARGSVLADLTQAGTRMLAHARGRPVVATLLIAVHGGSPLTRSVRIAFTRRSA